MVSKPKAPYQIEIAAGTYSVTGQKDGMAFVFDNGLQSQTKTAVVKPGQKTVVNFVVTKKK